MHADTLIPNSGDFHSSSYTSTACHAPSDGTTSTALDAVVDWSLTLSLGEQQRLAWARLLLTKPRLALLDEASSALDQSIEADLYQASTGLRRLKKSRGGNKCFGRAHVQHCVCHLPGCSIMTRPGLCHTHKNTTEQSLHLFSTRQHRPWDPLAQRLSVLGTALCSSSTTKACYSCYPRNKGMSAAKRN